MAALQLSQEAHNGGNEQNELALAHSGGLVEWRTETLTKSSGKESVGLLKPDLCSTLLKTAALLKLPNMADMRKGWGGVGCIINLIMYLNLHLRLK